jgi:hypothetical protein
MDENKLDKIARAISDLARKAAPIQETYSAALSISAKQPGINFSQPTSKPPFEYIWNRRRYILRPFVNDENLTAYNYHLQRIFEEFQPTKNTVTI